MTGKRSSGCAATSPGRRFPRAGRPSPARARRPAYRRRPIGKAPPTRFSSRWISSRAWRRWCRDPARMLPVETGPEFAGLVPQRRSGIVRLQWPQERREASSHRIGAYDGHVCFVNHVFLRPSMSSLPQMTSVRAVLSADPEGGDNAQEQRQHTQPHHRYSAVPRFVPAQYGHPRIGEPCSTPGPSPSTTKPMPSR